MPSVKIAFNYLDNGDLGFKVLENQAHLNGLCNDVPYIFKRSEIEKEIRTSDPHNLYLRSKIRAEDYEIRFKNADDLDNFLKLFPEAIHDEWKTINYYILPYPRQTSPAIHRTIHDASSDSQ